jgi:hypothetical protein
MIFFPDVSPRMSLQVLFVKEYNLPICAIAKIYLKSLVSAHVNRKLASPIEYLPTVRLTAHYI